MNFRVLLLPAVCVGVIALGGIGSDVRGADWPRLGGPLNTGASPETGLARSWSSEGPAVLWKAEVGEGFAGAAVRDGEVYVLDRVPGEKDILRCLSLESGAELWKLSFDAPGTLGNNNGSRNVPTVDAEYVFALGPMGQLRCVDRKTHAVVWSVHLVEDFKDPEVDRAEAPKNRAEKLLRAQVPLWGVTQAPLLYKDLVIVAPQTQKTGLVAYERSTGKIRWRSDYVGRNWYSHVSPYLTTLCGVEQIIMMAQPSDPEKAPKDAPPAIVSSVDPETGRILWRTNTPGPDKIPIPSPLGVGENRLFITAGYTLGSLMLEVTHTNAEWQPKFLSRNQGVAGHIHSPALYNNRIYVTSFKQHGATNTGLVCLKETGEILWKTGQETDDGSFVLADGMVYVMHGKTGQLSLYALGDEGPKLLASAKVLDGENGAVWAPMALSQGRLIVRDQHVMKCLKISQQ